MTTVYDNILVLQENGSVAIVGEYDQLLEDDKSDGTSNDTQIEQKAKKEAVGAISNLVNGFRGKGNEISKVAGTLDKFPKGGGIAKMISYLGVKVVTKGDSLFKAIYTFVDKLWSFIKGIPGIGAIATSMSKFVNNMLDGKEIGFGDHKVDAKELIKFITTTFVLVGLSGYIIKKIKNKLKEKQTEKQESAAINFATSTEPLILTEGTDGKANTLLKRAPGIIGTLIDFAKNIKDSAGKFIINTIGVIIAFGIFTLGALVSKPMVCRAIRSYNKALAEGKKKATSTDTGISKAISAIKKGGVAIMYHMAKVITFGLSGSGIDIYLSCDGIDAEASRKAKAFISSK